MKVCIFCSAREATGDNAVTPFVCPACELGSYPSNFEHVLIEDRIAEFDSQEIMAGAIIRGEMLL